MKSRRVTGRLCASACRIGSSEAKLSGCCLADNHVPCPQFTSVTALPSSAAQVALTTSACAARARAPRHERVISVELGAHAADVRVGRERGVDHAPDQRIEHDGARRGRSAVAGAELKSKPGK
jgi:hypothetical protein